MKLRVHLRSGASLDFQCESWEQITERLNPRKIFDQPAFFIDGEISKYGFAPSAIELIEAASGDNLELIFPGNLQYVELIPQDLFAELHHELQPVFRERIEEETAEYGDQVVALAQVGLASGRQLNLRYRVDVQPRHTRRINIMTIFEQIPFFIHRHGGGALLFNPAHAEYWLLHPGPAESPIQTIGGKLLT